MPPLVDLLTGDLPSMLIAIAGVVAAAILLRRRPGPALLVGAGSVLWLAAEAFSLAFTAIDRVLQGQLADSQIQIVETVYLLAGNLLFAAGIALVLTAALVGLRRRAG
jgi:hypothetical protein